jgi:peptidoglycan/LPS O-acetylase OafA/YrhL
VSGGHSGGGAEAAALRHRIARGFGQAGPATPVRSHPTIPSLDGFRAIAILIVVVAHAGLASYVPGQFGVTLFFFLSGYLITTLLRRELIEHGGVDFQVFYLRRAVRILPPMWAALALAIVFAALGLNHPLNAQWLAYDFAFLTNYFPFSSAPIGLWSLAVEEHFYLLFPVAAMALTARHGARACALACTIACLLVLEIRSAEYLRRADPTDIAFLTHTRLDSILFGAVLGLWNNPVIDRENRLPAILPSYLIGGALLAVSFVLRDETFRYTVRYTIQGIALILIFNAAIRDQRLAHRLVENGPVRLLAALSYLIYLVHGIFLEAAELLEPAIGRIGATATALLATFGVSYLLHLCLERPLLRWRRTTERRWRLTATRAARRRIAGGAGVT